MFFGVSYRLINIQLETRSLIPLKHLKHATSLIFNYDDDY
jgi:hypothetical protein